MNKLEMIYKKLYSYFGPQHWWPAETRFEVMVGAILTQNTSWVNVRKAIYNLKKHRALDKNTLYRLTHKRLSTLIRPAGYYNIKAKRLKEFLKFFFRTYKGDLRRMSSQATEELRQLLLSVNGIGPETADSILLYALEKPIFVVDAYTRRILIRHKLIKDDSGYEQIQNLFMQNLNPVTNVKTIRRKNTICKGVKKDAGHVRNVKSLRSRKKISNVVQLFNEYHALLVRLGKEFCLKTNPRCDICPLKNSHT